MVPRFSKRPCAGVVQELGFKVTLQSKTWNCIHVFNGNAHAILLNVKDLEVTVVELYGHLEVVDGLIYATV